MDIFQRIPSPENKPVFCVDMHTCGEPTRIVILGYPNLLGTLMQQRHQAKSQYDHIRKRLLLEPRGHYDMYGAILRPRTELTQTGEAHMGVLFMTNDGFSTMCGHATIALGRFLVDTQDLNIFPSRNDIVWDRENLIAHVNIHAPYGVLEVAVPTNRAGNASDPNRPVTFVSTPSFATGLDIPIDIGYHWPQLFRRGGVTNTLRVNFAFGGAFYAIVDFEDLAFGGRADDVDMGELGEAVRCLLVNIRAQRQLVKFYQHPEEPEMSALYGVLVTSNNIWNGAPVADAELGVCFFADQQIDRSPTGRGVAARAALAYSKGEREVGVPWKYHSLASHRGVGQPFLGTILPPLDGDQIVDRRGAQMRVKVEGYAYYTGQSTLIVEPEDPLGDSGFAFRKL